MSRTHRYLIASIAACCLLFPAAAQCDENLPSKRAATIIRRNHSRVCAPDCDVNMSSGRVETEQAELQLRLKAWLDEPRRLSFDRDGTIRDPIGRPVGYWGVDEPLRLPMRQRRDSNPLQRPGRHWGIDGLPAATPRR
jgi:hypothetical protein